jgi:hypothetical protein
VALAYDLGSEDVVLRDEYPVIHHDDSFLLLVSLDFPDSLAMLASLPDFFLDDYGFRVVLLACFDFVYDLLVLWWVFRGAVIDLANGFCWFFEV